MFSRGTLLALAVTFVAFVTTGCGDDSETAIDIFDASAAADTSVGTDARAATRVDVTLAAGTVSLTGYMTTSAASPAGAPGVVLIHQFQQTDEQWGDLPDVLAARGYRVLAFNLRGHGGRDFGGH